MFKDGSMVNVDVVIREKVRLTDTNSDNHPSLASVLLLLLLRIAFISLDVCMSCTLACLLYNVEENMSSHP